MLAMNLDTIVQWINGCDPHQHYPQVVKALITDTRMIGEGDVFVALRGEHYDGHNFVEVAAARGAVGAIIANDREYANLPSHAFALIRVDRPLHAYQAIAARYRELLNCKVVAVTGSNGKTSTKDLVAAVLTKDYKVHKTESNYNNHIGVPRTVLGAGQDDGVVVLEVGMNHPGEIAPLAAIAQPDIAIVTNIGTAHLEFMKTRDAIASEKGALLEHVRPGGSAILPAEDFFVDVLIKRSNCEVITVGETRGDMRAEILESNLRGSRFNIVENSQRHEAFLPVPGRHMVMNALFAIAAGRCFGTSMSDCVEALASAQLTKGRMEMKKVAGMTIIDDSYNANRESMIAATQILASSHTDGRRIAVLGHMGELGDNSADFHAQVGAEVVKSGIDVLVTVGETAKAIAIAAIEGGMSEVITVFDTAQAAKILVECANSEDLVLIKGSRSASMENVIKELTALDRKE